MGNYEGLSIEQKSKAQIKKIWMTAGLLAVVTLIEYAIAFTVGYEWLAAKNFAFIALTIVKAFYIVAEFMHLKHEVKVLIWSVLLPCLFVVWLIIALLVEGDYVFAKFAF